jgi:hypothetical protein
VPLGSADSALAATGEGAFIEAWEGKGPKSDEGRPEAVRAYGKEERG